MTNSIDRLTRLARLEILQMSAQREQYASIPQTLDETNNKLWDMYKTYLKTARDNPSFNLQQTLNVFRYLCVRNDDLKQKIESDYRELRELKIDNPFHI